MNIIEALSDRNLFGGLSVFHDLTTWRPWLGFISAVYGLPLSPEDQRIFCQHTGRSVYTPRPGGYPETVACIGRQSGKTRIAGTILGYEAIRPAESDGTSLYAVCTTGEPSCGAEQEMGFSVARNIVSENLLMVNFMAPMRFRIGLIVAVFSLFALPA